MFFMKKIDFVDFDAKVINLSGSSQPKSAALRPILLQSSSAPKQQRSEKSLLHGVAEKGCSYFCTVRINLWRTNLFT
jgi:hypothetical protein